MFNKIQPYHLGYVAFSLIMIFVSFSLYRIIKKDIESDRETHAQVIENLKYKEALDKFENDCKDKCTALKRYYRSSNYPTDCECGTEKVYCNDTDEPLYKLSCHIDIKK